MFTPITEDDQELAWDFYLYIATGLLHLSINDFLHIKPRLLLRLYIKHLEYTQPEALKKEQVTYTLDQTPFL
ncbi:hypothetical protein [Enterococcus dispar]|uniref:hypothetical protein n=1 Tax=Enterococcus dispar TaxID=44009 RepID=UPI001E47FE45|nr:hypothetical protein [Enterococcus dispar]WCG33000.1 hypothetical protein PML78_12535 [Enterococcus dispar]